MRQADDLHWLDGFLRSIAWQGINRAMNGAKWTKMDTDWTNNGQYHVVH